MEPYRANMRGSYNRNMNSGCNQGNQMSNQNRQISNQMSNQSRQMNNQNRYMMGQNRQMMNQHSDCQEARTLPVKEKNCDCKDNNSHMRHMALGIGYVPIQEWGDLYDMETAHCQGTIFPDLNLIFCGARGKM